MEKPANNGKQVVVVGTVVPYDDGDAELQSTEPQHPQ
jgi:hypothetical protein